jgi:hypothetical protein
MMKKSNVAVAKRVAVVALVAFGGCTAFDHGECVEYPSIHGPCSWQHSAWHTVSLFALSALSVAVFMLVMGWVLLPTQRGKKPPHDHQGD